MPVYSNRNQVQPTDAKAYLEAALGMTAEESLTLLLEKAMIQKEMWNNEFDEWFNSDIASLKEAAKGKAVSIFDKEEISSGIKEFLEDKPITAVRYQRLYEQNPAKAEMFLTNMMTDYSVDSYSYLDAKYQGQDYMDVLEHINALLEKNIKDVENGFTNRPIIYHNVFNMDDNTGSNDKPQDRPQVYVSERFEYELGKYTNIQYLKMYKPIGTGDNSTMLIIPQRELQLISDNGFDSTRLFEYEKMIKTDFFNTSYWFIS